MENFSKDSYVGDPERECLPRARLRQLQEERLAELLHRVAHRVPFYKARLWTAGFEPEKFRGLADLPAIPFTTKEDLREHYPYGLLALPRDQVARVHASSGTTGRPTLTAYSRKDLELWSELMARVLAAAGVRAGTVVQIAYGYGMFTGGSGFQYGAERLGATVIPASSGHAEKQLLWMRELGTEVLLCTPSFAATLLQEIAGDLGHRPLSLKAGIFGGEFWSEALRARLEQGLGVRAFDTYGLSEVIGPGVAQECPEGGGMHVFEDHFLPEIVDPVSGEPLPPGSYGELVLTSLTKEAMPVLRYRTRDRTRLIEEPCACGRSSRRIERIWGRADDQLRIGDGQVFLSQIEQVLLETEGVQPNYQVVATSDLAAQESPWVLKAQLVEEVLRSRARTEAVEAKVTEELQQRFGLKMRVTGVRASHLPCSEGKAKRLIYE